MRTIFWDIETSPNLGFFWRPGYKVRITHDNIVKERKILCICWKYEGEEDVYYLTWDKKQNDEEMIREFSEYLNECDLAIAHNGDRFDLPWVKGRMAQIGSPIDPNLKTVDTLYWSKKMGFNSNRLDYLGQYLLGYGKTETSYDMWKEIVLNNDRKVLDEMVDYCINDVVLLEEVYEALLPFNKPKVHQGVHAGGEKWHCPYTGSDNVKTNKRRVTAAGTVQWQMINKDTGRYFTISDKAHRDYKEAKK